MYFILKTGIYGTKSRIPYPEIRGVEPSKVDWLVLAPKWRPLNGVDPSCWILKSNGSNILHDITKVLFLHLRSQKVLLFRYRVFKFPRETSQQEIDGESKILILFIAPYPPPPGRPPVTSLEGGGGDLF
jgi:hypothetical protein